MKNIKNRLFIIVVSIACMLIKQAQAGQFGRIAVKYAAPVVSALVLQQKSWSDQDQASNDQVVDAVKYPEFAKFVKKYRCSPEIERQVHENKNKVEDRFNGVYQYEQIPFFNKGKDIGRIINALRMKKVIAAHKLDRIDVPDKCLCRMQENEWNVIAKAVKFNRKDMHISLQEAQQLVKLVEETNYGDFHDGNIVKDGESKMTCIDTEDRSYDSYERRISSMYNLKFFMLRVGVEDKPFVYVNNYINMDLALSLEVTSNLSFGVPVSHNNQYNDSDIDFEKVKKEFAALNEELTMLKKSNDKK